MNHSDEQRLIGRIHQHLYNISKEIRASNHHYSLDTQVFTIRQAEREECSSEIIASIKVDSPFSTNDDRLNLLRGQFGGLLPNAITEDHVTNAMLRNASRSASVDLYCHGSERRALHVLHDMLSGKSCGIANNRMPAFAVFSAAINAVLRQIHDETRAFSMLTEEDEARGWRVYPELRIEHFLCDVANITLSRSIASPHQDYSIRYDLNLSLPVARLARLETPRDITKKFIRDALLTAVESAIDAHTAAGEMQLVSIARELGEVFSSMLEKQMLEHACGDHQAIAARTIKI